jgi:hypothetical protein
MPEWLERELKANLAPVEAPEALRLPLPNRVPSGPGSDRRVSAFLIAAAMVVLSAGTLWLSARQPARIAPTRWKANDHNCVLCHTL